MLFIQLERRPTSYFNDSIWETEGVGSSGSVSGHKEFFEEVAEQKLSSTVENFE